MTKTKKVKIIMEDKNLSSDGYTMKQWDKIIEKLGIKGRSTGVIGAVTTLKRIK